MPDAGAADSTAETVADVLTPVAPDAGDREVTVTGAAAVVNDQVPPVSGVPPRLAVAVRVVPSGNAAPA